MIEKLGHFEANVVSFKLVNQNREVLITEACDEYFSVTLNKVEFSELIDDLTALRDQMQE